MLIPIGSKAGVIARTPKIWVAAVLLLTAVFVLTRSVDSQPCCVVPDTEVSGIQQEQFPGSLTAFNMTISNAQGANFDGRQVQEEYGSNQGINSCYYPNGPTPQHPVVSNPSAQVPPWIVAGGDVAGQHNHWGLDLIGLLPADIDQLRAERPDLLPCQLVIYQNMWIECDASTHFVYEQNNSLFIVVYEDRVQNCRSGVLDNANRCETLYR